MMKYTKKKINKKTNSNFKLKNNWHFPQLQKCRMNKTDWLHKIKTHLESKNFHQLKRNRLNIELWKPIHKNHPLLFPRTLGHERHFHYFYISLQNVMIVKLYMTKLTNLIRNNNFRFQRPKDFLKQLKVTALLNSMKISTKI